MAEGEGGYEPSDEEIQKAGEMMTDDERKASSSRSHEKEEQSRQEYRERREKMRLEDIQTVIKKASDGLMELVSKEDFADQPNHQINLQDKDERGRVFNYDNIFESTIENSSGYSGMSIEEKNGLYEEIMNAISENTGFPIRRTGEDDQRRYPAGNYSDLYLPTWLIDIKGRTYSISLDSDVRSLKLKEVK